MKTSYNANFGFNVRKAIYLLAVLLIAGYVVWNARIYIAGPSIEIFNRVDNIEVVDNPLNIKGVAKNTSYIDINGRNITIDKNGYFDEQILLDEGFNQIIMNGRDRFGQETRKEIRVYYKKE